MSRSHIHLNRSHYEYRVLEFTSFSREGGVLILPEGADREDLVDTEKLYPYLREHASDWYQYFNGYSDVPLAKPTLNGTLFLVTGSDRAIEWSLAQFPSSNSQPDRPTVFRHEQQTGKNPHWVEISWIDKLCSTDISSRGKPCAVFIRGISFGLSDSSWAHGMAMIPRDVTPFYYIPSVPVIGWRADLERYISRYRRPPSDDVTGLWQHMFLPALALLPVLLDLVRSIPNQDGYESNHLVGADCRGCYFRRFNLVSSNDWGMHFAFNIGIKLISHFSQQRSLVLDEFLSLFHRIFVNHDVNVSNGVELYILSLECNI